MSRLVGEAIANTTARPVLNLGLVVVVAAMLTGTAIAEINAMTSTRIYERKLIDGGYATLLVEQDNPGESTLSTTTCRILEAINGVSASVAMRDPESFTLWTADGPQVSLGRVSADIVAFLRAANPDSMGAWTNAQTFVDSDSTAASPAPDQYPLRVVDRAGSAFDTDAYTAALTPLGAGASGSILAIDASQGPVRACALFVATPYRDHVNRSITAALPVLEGFSQRWALSSAERFETPQHRFEQRPSQYYWAIATLAFMALALLQLRLRRSDHALYAISGLDRRRVWTLATSEVLAILVAAITLSSLIVATATRHYDISNDNTAVGWTALARFSVAATAATLALAWSAATRTTTATLDAIKDR